MERKQRQALNAARHKRHNSQPMKETSIPSGYRLTRMTRHCPFAHCCPRLLDAAGEAGSIAREVEGKTAGSADAQWKGKAVC